MESSRRAVLIQGRKLVFPKQNEKVAIDGNSINAQQWSLKGHPIRFILRDTKLFFENNLIASVNSKRIELTEFKKNTQGFRSSLSVFP